MIRSVILWCSIFLFEGFSAFGQVNDAQMWLSIAGQKRITKNCTIILNPEFRIGENIGKLNRFSSDVGFEYKVSRYIKGALFYRFILDRMQNNSYESKHRFYVDINAKVKAKKLVVNYRVRYQNQYQDVGGGIDWRMPKSYLRNKVAVRYVIGKRWTPSINYELWTNLDDRMNDNFRVGTSIDYELNKRNALSFSYFYNKEINSTNPWTFYIVMAEFVHTF